MVLISVRLVEMNNVINTNRGRVEFYQNGKWRSICKIGVSNSAIYCEFVVILAVLPLSLRADI